MLTKFLQFAFELTYPLVVLLFLLLIIARQGERVAKIAAYEQAISGKAKQFLWPWLHETAGRLVQVVCLATEYLFDSILGGLESISEFFDSLENRHRIDLNSGLQPLSLQGAPSVSTVDAEKVAEMAVRIWGESRFSRADRVATYQDWLAHDPECIKWILPPGTANPIGFTCFFALKQDMFDRFQRGRMSQRTFEGRDFEQAKPQNVFIQAVAIHKSALVDFSDRKKLDSYIHSHILEHIAIFARRALPGKTTFDEGDLAALPVVCADICEPAGELMARHYTFKEHAKNTIDKTKIFLLEPARFKDPNEPPERRHRLRQFLEYLNGKRHKSFDFKDQTQATQRNRVWWKAAVWGINLAVSFLTVVLLVCLLYRIYVWALAAIAPFTGSSG